MNLARTILRCGILGGDSPNDEKNFNVSLGLLLARLSVGPKALTELLHTAEVPKQRNLLIVVDQFEEIFRFYSKHNANEALKFVNLLIATAEDRSVPVFIVLTMRSDYLGDCSLFPGLPEMLNDAQFLCPRLSRDQMREAIELPARCREWDVDSDLIGTMINDIEANSDQLPLVQHSLMRTWFLAKRIDSEGPRNDPPRRLTIDHYTKVGGVSESLDLHADEVYRSIGGSPIASDGNAPAEKRSLRQRICERMFRCLSDVNSRGQVIRRLATVQEIQSVIEEASINEVIEVAKPFLAADCSFLDRVSER